MTKPEIPQHRLKWFAIDIHTHAEEPCGMHGDDGYDDFQAQMPNTSSRQNKHPHDGSGNRGPTIAPRKLPAVIFPVDARA